LVNTQKGKPRNKNLVVLFHSLGICSLYLYSNILLTKKKVGFPRLLTDIYHMIAEMHNSRLFSDIVYPGAEPGFKHRGDQV